MKIATAEEFVRDGRSVVHRPTKWRFTPYPVEAGVPKVGLSAERQTEYSAGSVWDVAWDLLRDVN